MDDGEQRRRTHGDHLRQSQRRGAGEEGIFPAGSARDHAPLVRAGRLHDHEEVSDEGWSGAYLERPGLDRVRDLVAAGGVDVVVVLFRDRLARGIHAGLLAEEFKGYGTRLVALNAQVDDSPEGELQGGLLDLFAAYERSVFRRRSERGLNRKVAEGKVIRGARACFGFRYDERGETPLISEAEMEVVRRIFRMVGAEGLSLGEVERQLNREGVPSPSGGRWRRQSVRYVVLNELYRPLARDEVTTSGLVPPEVVSALDEEKVYGLWIWNKMRVKRWRERTEGGEYRTRVKNEERPRGQQTAVPVDLSGAGLVRATVDTARERIGQNKQRPPSNRVRRLWQLSGGIARCQVCGHAFSPHTVHEKGKIRCYYRCYTRYNSGRDACTNSRHVRAPEFEEAVWNTVYRLLSEPERVRIAYDEHMERRKAQLRGDPNREARNLSERLQKLERRRSGYLDLAADGTVGREELRTKLAELAEQRKELEGALRKAQDRRESIRKLQLKREMMLGRFAAMRDIDLHHLDPENRRRALRTLGARVEVDENGNAHITGVFDADITELLPMTQAPDDEPYGKWFKHRILPPFQGVVTLTSATPCTS